MPRPAGPAGDPVLPPGAAGALLRWYRRSPRELPWRGTRDPYAILVAEIMLQQTRVETAARRYPAFLERFPDLRTLAAAGREEVLAAWSGLGYYRRARNLHELARRVVAGDGSRLPRTARGLRSLPGVGPYTAAAVAAIAFGEATLAVDGNVARVLCRLAAVREDPRRAAVRRRLAGMAAGWLRRHPAGLLTQALMDLGATVCVPRTPRCEECPCAALCSARALGIEGRIPPPRPRPGRRVWEAAALVERRGRYLLLRGQRPGLLQEMWEFPTLDSRLLGRAPGDRGDLAPLLEAHLRRLGLPVEVLEPVGEIRHGITDRRIRCRVHRARWVGGREGGPGRPNGPQARWCSPQEAARLPLAASARRIFTEIVGAEAGPGPA